jgi:acyl phosphate:glycerol-3-phosphate acyltransferase
MLVAIMLVAAYLLGAIPTAVIAGRLLKGIDIRTEGSGNAGATNTARVLGFKAGLVVAVIDLAKGLAAVLLVSRIAPLAGFAGAVLCGIAAIAGHVFPVFVGFRGGKGVATAGGAAIALFPILAPICLAFFLLTAALSRWVSLASLVAAFTLPAAYLVACALGATFDPWLLGFAVAVFLVTTVTHRGNIGRLLRGKEKQLDIRGMLRRRP